MIEPPTYDEARAALDAIEHVCPEGVARLSWTIVSDWMDYAQERIGGQTLLVEEMEQDIANCSCHGLESW